jgi:hypothetical protein
MRWYVSREGEVVGPIEASELNEWLRTRPAEARDGIFVRDEAASAWAPIDQSPFASLPPAAAVDGAPAIAEHAAPSHATTTPEWMNTALLGGAVALGLAIAIWANIGRSKRAEPAAAEANVATSFSSAVDPTPQSPATMAAPFLSEVDADWAAFDALPARQRTKAELQARLSKQEGIVRRAPAAASPLVANHSLMQARRHFSVWSTVGTSAGGENATDLIPASDKAQCLVSGSMWIGDVDTLTAIMKLGFLRVVCPGKTWLVKEEANVCYLWSVDPDDRRAKGVVTIWTTLELLSRAQVVGRRTDDEGPLALIALMSGGRSTTMVGGVKGTIVEVGEGWFKVEGTNFGGYVLAEHCHHTSTK